MQKIALLGTGIMGAPMAQNIARAGYRVAVWNRTREKAERLAGLCRVCATPSEAVAGADIAITMLANGAAVTEVLFGKEGIAPHLRPGAVVVDMSSIQPGLARDHAAALGAREIAHLDAPVSGGEKGAEEATLAIMAGGEAEDFAAAEPVLATMGRPTHVGVHGAGQVAKLANQVIVAISIGAVSEALLLAQEGGCEPAAVRAALMGGFATSRILELHGQRMIERDWIPGGPIEMQLKDLDNALEVAREAGLDLPLTRLARRAYHDLAHGMGLGRNDHAAYLRWLEAQNPGFRLGEGSDRLP